jgi:acyl-CoA thioester hydrolase
MESRSEIRVRYAESDQMGVAYHANYLVWCEVGRTDLIRQIGMTYAEMERRGVLLAVADAQLRFHASARYDDVVRIVTRLTGVRSRMVTFTYELFRLCDDGTESERLASASTTLVSLDRDGKPAALPSEMRDLLSAALDGNAGASR